MKKEFKQISKQRFITGLLALFMLVTLTGCNFPTFSSIFDCEKQNNTETLNPIPEEKYAYSSFDDVTYTSNLKYEYANFLSGQGKMYYDAFSKYSWELTYLYYFDNSESYDASLADEAYRFYNYDHPESELIHYRVDSYCSYYSKEFSYKKIAIWGKQENDSVQKEEYELKLKEIDETIADLVNEVNMEKNLIAKYRLIYDYLTTTVEYDHEEFDSIVAGNGIICDDNHNIYGAIVNKKAVCDGISDAFKYICNKCNLECVTITGDLDSTKDKDYCHQWNIVPINGNWFLIDCTFDLKTSDKDISQSYLSYDENSETITIKSKLSYFLYNDITVEGRTPLKYVTIGNIDGEEPKLENVYGYPCSKYEDSSVYPKLTPKKSTEKSNTLYTVEGVTFTCNEDFEFINTNNGGAFALTTEALEALWDSNYTSSINDSITLSTNAKIVEVMYYDGNNLYKIDECNEQDLEVVFHDFETNVYSEEFIVLVEYQNVIYQLRFCYTGM